MYPNAQDALPLPPRANLEWYRKQAKDLLKAARADDPQAVHDWTARLIGAIAEAVAEQPSQRERDRRAGQIEEFVRARLASTTSALSDAQFVVARTLGFASWPRLVRHAEAMVKASPVSAFEAAADAIVSGDLDTLTRLLREHPALARARSTREHHATLLHYVSANGVEDFRQRTPKNAPEIARTLLNAGAEVDAHADVYGGGATTLGLVATSIHPEQAGVQLQLLDILLDHGARMEERSPAGNDHGIVEGCLANGQPAAAAYLASKGAALNLEGAAGIGRLDAVQRFVDEDGTLRHATPQQLHRGFALACGYGHPDVVTYLLAAGVRPDERLRLYGNGHTGLHLAAYHAHVEIARELLRRGASVSVTDETWGTTPLAWALHGWSEDRTAPADRYREVVRLLVGAGAEVTPEVTRILTRMNADERG
ncbi:MAG: ankyrin repeat domain-containing protein [Gemmatimonadaceae bacterium]